MRVPDFPLIGAKQIRAHKLGALRLAAVKGRQPFGRSAGLHTATAHRVPAVFYGRLITSRMIRINTGILLEYEGETNSSSSNSDHICVTIHVKQPSVNIALNPRDDVHYH